MRSQARRPLSALALALALAACGGSQQAAPPPKKPAEPPPDPAMAEILVELRAQKARMCGCADAACAEQAEVAQFEWAFAHKELLDRAKATPAQEAEADELVGSTEECADRWH